jgi:hypothetical protein
MALIERSIETDACGYRQVTLGYRIARAAMLDAAGASKRTGRIACPGLDASRSDIAYGRCALPGTTSADLEAWSRALGVNSAGIKAVAYFSGPFWSIPGAILRGRFDDGAVNTGFIRSLKRHTNTGILNAMVFDQQKLNSFIWAARPDLSGREMTENFLYSPAADRQYIDTTMLPDIRAYNAGNADSLAGSIARKLGSVMSNFEMTDLLLGTLAQPIHNNPNEPAKTVEAIHLRDVHDLFKYALLPAVAEERLSAAGLLSFPPVHTLAA